jgi:hypothetical protein
MKLGTFSPTEIVLAINDYVISDFSSESFLEITKNSPYFRQVRGIRGKHTRVANRDKSGVLRFQLMQTSPQNDVLSDLVTADMESQTALLNVTLRDVGGTTGIQLVNAYVDGPPNKSYQGSSTTANEWVINYDAIGRYHVGGNQKSPLDFLSNLF